MNPKPAIPNPIVTSQLGTVIIGSVAGLAVCAIIAQLISPMINKQPSVPVTG